MKGRINLFTAAIIYPFVKSPIPGRRDRNTFPCRSGVDAESCHDSEGMDILHVYTHSIHVDIRLYYQTDLANRIPTYRGRLWPCSVCLALPLRSFSTPASKHCRSAARDLSTLHGESHRHRCFRCRQLFADPSEMISQEVFSLLQFPTVQIPHNSAKDR